MTRNRICLVVSCIVVLGVATLVARPAPSCERWWYSETFFKTATVEEVTECLTAGADVNLRVEGLPALHRAAEYSENPAVIEVLMEAGADVHARDMYGRTPVFYAVWNPPAFEMLAEAGADLNVVSKVGATLLSWAASGGAPAVVELLLAAGADINARAAYGLTPLHSAAAGEAVAVVELLLANGADVNARDDDNETPLHGAAMWSGWADADARHHTDRVLDTAVVEALLAAGASLEARNNDGWTPLHSAARFSRNSEVIELLLAAGADVHARNKDGDTALDVSRFWSIVQMLRTHMSATRPVAPDVEEPPVR